MRLSEYHCKNFKPLSKIKKHYDGDGLYLEVTPSGGKHWKLKYLYGGKEKKLSIGTYPLITLKEARDRRVEAKKLLDQNIDPSIAKKQAKRKALLESTTTFKQVAEEWHQNTLHKWTDKHAKSITSRLENHLFPKIGKLPIKTITPQILLTALKEIEAIGIYDTTKRIKQYTSQIFKYAIVTGKAEINAAEHISGFLKPPKTKHYSALTSEDLPEFLDKLYRNEARLYYQTQKAIELKMLTLVRTQELTNATWQEIDLEKKLWLIPAERMKMKREHLVPLSNQVLQILEDLKKLTSPNGYILPSPITPKKPISENTIICGLYRMGYKHKTTAHGFRALGMTTILEKLDYQKPVVDRQLAHANGDSNGRAYDRAEYLDKRIIMMQEWGDYVESLN